MNHHVEIGYCGNVHPAVSVDQLIDNLNRHTAQVRKELGVTEAMPFGIWLSAQALEQLQTPETLTQLQQVLDRNSLVPFTVNGFPFGDFHQSVVKQAVYLPDWTDDRRLDYTLRLADLHHRLLPVGAVSTISTLPLGWPTDGCRDEVFLQRCAENLRSLAIQLDRRYQQTGRLHMVCIEPEPGCVLDCCQDIVDFFQQHLLPPEASQRSLVRTHIGVCHDICHSAVMFEPQDEAMSAYVDAGITIGKIQVSSAVEVDFDSMDDRQKQTAMTRLAAFSEPKYLHQTSVRFSDGRRDFFTDLPDALIANDGDGVWRIHFHVPIFYQGDGMIGTTGNCIAECLDALERYSVPVQHFEVETYAWPVLPPGIFDGSLNEGIAQEIRWFKELYLTD